MTRREFTREQRAEMVHRAMRDNVLRCEGCGLDLTGKRIEFDHVIAEALILDKRRALTAGDGQLLGRDCCHRGPDGKTALDIDLIARAKRREAGHRGFGKGRSAGLRKAPPQRSASRPLERRT